MQWHTSGKSACSGIRVESMYAVAYEWRVCVQWHTSGEYVCSGIRVEDVHALAYKREMCMHGHTQRGQHSHAVA